MNMERKIALVTGAGRGIGQGIAIQLAKNGYDVGIHYSSSAEGAQETADTCRSLGARAELFQADIRNVEEIYAMFAAFEEKFDHLDLMVNNAGITRFQPFLEATPEMFDTVLYTDLRGSYFCAQAAARNMVKNEVRGFYAAAKAGLEKAGKNMAMELAPYGIRVVTIAPGYTATKAWNVPENGPVSERHQKIINRIPAGRYARPWEIGDAVVFLASDSAGYITGTTLFIDGGALLPVIPENRYSD